jgi:DNA-binding protein HU-beta
VSFIGFGAFTVTDRAARITKVPGTAQSVEVSASKVVKFKVGKKLKNLVSGKKHL